MKISNSFRFLIILLTGLSQLNAQQTISFVTSDGVKIYADLYLKDPGLPYVILLHEEECSRGAFRNTAPRFLNLGYNCLVPDLRNGKKSNYIENLTVNELPDSMVSQNSDISLDIKSAIQFAWDKNGKKVILAGFRSSASMAMMEAKSNPKVQAVIAFSPGEYFLPELSVTNSIIPFNKLAFIYNTPQEKTFLKELYNGLPKNLCYFSMGSNNSIKGSDILSDKNPEKESIWLELMIFLGKIKNNPIYLNP